MLRENCQVLFASYLWAISIIPIIFFGKKKQQQQQQQKKTKQRKTFYYFNYFKNYILTQCNDFVRNSVILKNPRFFLVMCTV